MIVYEYFGVWANIMKRYSDKLVYLDLFSGRGFFDDGNISTPLMILDYLNTNSELLEKVELHFYEQEEELINDLQEKVTSHVAYNQLKFKPIFNCKAINSKLIKELPVNDQTFTFIDPCGFSDLSEDLLLGVLENWGNDCVFYLSTYGIRRNIKKDNQRANLVRIFGEQEYETLRENFKSCKNAKQQDRLILKTVDKVLNKEKKIYSCGIRIDFEHRKMSNYFLVFISKHWRGFKIMKEIMSKHSISDSDGVPDFVFNTRLMGLPKQRPLIRNYTKLENIKTSLINIGFSKPLTFENICTHLQLNKFPFNDSNIKRALLELESEGKIVVDKPPEKRIKNGEVTLGPKRIVTFR